MSSRKSNNGPQTSTSADHPIPDLSGESWLVQKAWEFLGKKKEGHSVTDLFITLCCMVCVRLANQTEDEVRPDPNGYLKLGVLDCAHNWQVLWNITMAGIRNRGLGKIKNKDEDNSGTFQFIKVTDRKIGQEEKVFSGVETWQIFAGFATKLGLDVKAENMKNALNNLTASHQLWQSYKNYIYNKPTTYARQLVGSPQLAPLVFGNNFRDANLASAAMWVGGAHLVNTFCNMMKGVPRGANWQTWDSCRSYIYGCCERRANPEQKIILKYLYNFGEHPQFMVENQVLIKALLRSMILQPFAKFLPNIPSGIGCLSMWFHGDSLDKQKLQRGGLKECACYALAKGTLKDLAFTHEKFTSKTSPALFEIAMNSGSIFDSMDVIGQYFPNLRIAGILDICAICGLYGKTFMANVPDLTVATYQLECEAREGLSIGTQDAVNATLPQPGMYFQGHVKADRSRLISFCPAPETQELQVDAQTAFNAALKLTDYKPPEQQNAGILECKVAIPGILYGTGNVKKQFAYMNTFADCMVQLDELTYGALVGTESRTDQWERKQAIIEYLLEHNAFSLGTVTELKADTAFSFKVSKVAQKRRIAFDDYQKTIMKYMRGEPLPQEQQGPTPMSEEF